MVTVASLGVKIGADLKDFQKGMGNLQKGLDQAGRQMRAVGKTLSIGLTAPLVALGAKSLQVFNQQQQALAQVESAVRSTGGAAGFAVEELARQASALQANTIFGDEEILKNVTANLLTFTRITGEEFTKTQGLVLDLATRMGTDLTSATIQLGKALNDPVANLGALSRAGIQFTKEQKEVIKSLVEGGRQAEAQRIILDELEVQFGGAAEAAAQAGLGGFKQLQNSVGDLLESFGELMLPIVNDVVEVLRNVVDRLQAMSPEAKKTALAVVGLAAAIGPALFVLGGMASGFSAIIGAMGTLAALANPVVLAFAAIAAIGIAVYRNWDAVTLAFKGTYTAITDLVTNLKDNFVTTMSGIFEAVSLAIKGKFTEAWETLKTTATGGASDIVTDLGTFATDAGAAVAPLATALVTDPFQIGDFFEEGVVGEITTAVTGIKNDIASNLDTDQDSVSNSADAAKTALAAIRTEVGGIEALAPSFKTLEDALSGSEVSADDVEEALQDISTEVGLVEALAPSFATLRKALGSDAVGDMSISNAGSAASLGVKGVGDEVIALEKIVPNVNGIIGALNGEEGSIASNANDAEDAVKDLYDLIPSELTLPEGYEDILDIIPDANETHRWSKFVTGMGTLEGDIKEASGFSFQFAGYIGDIETAWGKLVPKSAPKWMQDLSTYATDAALVVAGLESMVTLLQPATWTQAIATIGKLAAGLAGIVAALAPAIGAGIAIYSIARLFGIGDSETPWERMGITQEEWEQMNIESGANAAFISNLMGPGADLSWLTNPSGETPSWLQGLQNYQSGNSGSGTFGGLPQFGSMLSGLNASNVSGDMATMGSTQTININLDGQQIATATVPYMAGELELYGTNY